MSGSNKDDNVATLYVDNQSAIALAKNPVQHQRSKHIDIKYHFVRAEVQNGKVQLEYVPSEYNTTDVFTKPVSKVRLSKLISLKILTVCSTVEHTYDVCPKYRELGSFGIIANLYVSDGSRR